MLRNLSQLSMIYHHAAVLLFVLMAGCTVPKKSGQNTRIMNESPEKDHLGNALLETERSGNYSDAVLEYERLATEARGQERANFLLQQAAAMLRAGKIEIAASQLIELDDLSLTLEQTAYKDFLLAQIYIALEQPKDALNLLENIDLQMMAVELRPQLSALKAQVYYSLGRYQAMLDEYLQLEPLLLDDAAIAQHRQVLWHRLMSISVEDLRALLAQSVDQTINGWLSLADIARKYSVGTGRAMPSLLAWQLAFPSHPAADIIFPTLLEREKLTQKPTHIAVIIPESGPLSGIANIIRKGLLDAYYNDVMPRSSLRFYDAQADIGVRSIYLRAVNEGADIVVGPLDKVQVGELSRLRFMPVPILALNSLDDVSRWPKHLYRFGLFPEDEVSEMTAEILRDGYAQVLVLAPQSEWGQRMSQYIASQQQPNGLQVVDEMHYIEANTDFSKPLKRLMHLDQSESRRRFLSRALQVRLEFMPRKRRDVDALFMLAHAKKARELRPQMLFQYGTDLPVYATSHIYQVSADRVALRDIDNTFFVDIPWRQHGTSEIWDKLDALPDKEKDYARFYVFGVDAYSLLPYLNYLKQHTGEFYAGFSGRLSIDRASQVHRKLAAWEVHRGKVRAKPQVLLY